MNQSPGTSPQEPTGRPDPTAPRRRRAGWRAAAIAAVVAIAATGCITSAQVAGGVLTIVGSEYADVITLRLQAGNSNVLEVDDAGDPAVEHTFDRSTFTTIVVDGLEGDDTITLDSVNGVFTTTEVTTLLGGSGNDTLIGSVGAERLEGGPGLDTIDGNNDADVVLGGDDADLIVWQPGDGSDTVDGGGGADELRFEVSDGSDVIGLSDVGGHVRLTRNFGAVAMDLDALERVALPTIGGADVVTIGNLAATDLTALDIDLAATGGFDDGAVDEVRMPADAVVGRDGAAALVSGFGPQVRVRNGSAGDRLHFQGTAAVDLLQVDGTAGPDTVLVAESGGSLLVSGVTPGVAIAATSADQLDIDLGGGDDQLSASGNVAAMTTLDVDGGDGRDTLLGGNGNDVIDGGPDADTIDGNQGADVLRGGDGSDVVGWDPGDGSDVVLGGSGSDRLVFTGSGASEVFGVADVGGLARVTRNVGSIAVDLDSVETLELNTVDGSDVVTVDDLAATDLVSIEIDLASAGSPLPDAAADSVRVNGTAGVDTVAVVGIASAVEVLGLAPFVRIINADPGVDKLTVDGLGGADVLTASPAATALIAVVLLP